MSEQAHYNWQKQISRTQQHHNTPAKGKQENNTQKHKNNVQQYNTTGSKQYPEKNSLTRHPINVTNNYTHRHGGEQRKIYT
jgi:hypothetical protein